MSLQKLKVFLIKYCKYFIRRKMSSSFTHAPTKDTNGIPFSKWITTYWNTASFSGEQAAKAVMFADFREAYGIKGAYFASPVEIVDFASNLEHAVGAKKVLIPLGMPDFSNVNTSTVMKQCARQWVSGGANNANMSDENVITMYYAALQSLTFTAGSATTAEAQRKWFPVLVSITRSFKAFYDATAAARAVTEAMVITPGVNDMLQKALAHVFDRTAVWNMETKTEVLETIVRRSLRHGALFPGMSPGPFVVFILVPLLRNVIDDSMTSDAVLEHYNEKTGNLLLSLAESASPDAATMQSNTLAAFTRICDFEPALTVEHARDLITFCTDHKDTSLSAPWVEWGILPASPALIPSVLAAHYKVMGKADAAIPRVTPSSTTAFKVVSYNGVKWAGIQFASVGKYTITTHDLGIATDDVGNTLGKELVANWRVTTGDDILPRDREGYSSAGMHHEHVAGKWKYTTTRPFNMKKSHVLVVTDSHVELVQNGHTFVRLERGGKSVIMGFKNLWFTCTWEPLEETHDDPVAPTAATVAAPPTTAPDAAPAAASPLTLPPTALIEQLRRLAMSSS